jgi:hypothetical protein
MSVCHGVVQYYRTMSDTDVEMFVEFEEGDKSSESTSARRKDAVIAEASVV